MWNKIRRFIPALVISIITIVLMVAVIFVLLKKDVNGDMSMYMASYEELGIDVDRLLKKNKIPQYIIDEGRNANGELMALPFKSQGGEKFLSAAEELKAKGYGIVSTVEDIGNVVLWNSDQEWVVDGTLYIDPKREAYLDIAKELVDAGYTNNTAEGVWIHGSMI